MWYSELECPVGSLLLAADDVGLRLIHFGSPGRPARPGASWRRDGAVLSQVEAQLGEYFAGKRRQFDLPLAPKGTEFQLRVWDQLQAIGYGETISYGQLAQRIGNPSAARAVGLANGANPLPIVIPCHRVIGVDGSLTGYGGGLHIKLHLLRLEGVSVADGEQVSLL